MRSLLLLINFLLISWVFSLFLQVYLIQGQQCLVCCSIVSSKKLSWALKKKLSSPCFAEFNIFIPMVNQTAITLYLRLNNQFVSHPLYIVGSRICFYILSHSFRWLCLKVLFYFEFFRFYHSLISPPPPLEDWVTWDCSLLPFPSPLTPSYPCLEGDYVCV
jgi:hypothetical protein